MKLLQIEKVKVRLGKCHPAAPGQPGQRSHANLETADVGSHRPGSCEKVGSFQEKNQAVKNDRVIKEGPFYGRQVGEVCLIKCVSNFA